MNIIRTTILTISMSIALACVKTDDNQPKTPIFAGTSEITLIYPLDATTVTTTGNFSYSVPTGVQYVVFGLFNAKIITSGKSISNPSAFVAGSRDGLADFVRGTQSRATLHNYDQVSKDFVSTASNPGTATGYYWAVWGYDKYGNLTHSSPQRQVDLQ